MSNGGGSMTDFECQVLQELSVLKVQMEQLLGNGQPGRLHRLEGRGGGLRRSFDDAAYCDRVFDRSLLEVLGGPVDSTAKLER
jgi:hypothetical protein